jgi:membrane protein DedA with SNARE-associated domain
VVGAAAAALERHGEPASLFAATLCGLVISDGWKYWAGALAHRWAPARRWVSRPSVMAARERVLQRLGLTLFAARFVPGTRIPLYLACGLFKAPFERFLPLIILSATLYLGLAFTAFSLLGKAMGERVHAAAPFVAVGIVIIAIAIAVFRRPKAAAPAD